MYDKSKIKFKRKKKKEQRLMTDVYGPAQE
jgi:hypothetical protein